jgi:hypothetical protein
LDSLTIISFSVAYAESISWNGCQNVCLILSLSNTEFCAHCVINCWYTRSAILSGFGQ